MIGMSEENEISQTDEQVAALVQKGQKESFGILMDRYERKFFSYGRKFLTGQDNIEDVVQEVFIKTYQNIQSFDTSQKFSPWIYRIAHNTFVNALRKKNKSPLRFFDFDTFTAHPVYEDTMPVEREQQRVNVLIDQGLDKLSPEYREIIILYYIQNFSYKEIADILHIPIGTVSVRLLRAKKALKKYVPNEQKKPHKPNEFYE
jgi:RNA polymerase sigma-70 factor, ECF subfamily